MENSHAVFCGDIVGFVPLNQEDTLTGQARSSRDICRYPLKESWISCSFYLFGSHTSLKCD